MNISLKHEDWILRQSGAKGGVWSFNEQDHGTIEYNPAIGGGCSV